MSESYEGLKTQFLAVAKAEHEKLIAERTELAAQMDQLNSRLRELEKELRTLDPESYAPAKSNGSSSSYGPSEASVTKVLQVMWAEPAMTFTINSLATRTGLHPSSVQKVMEHLRQSGDVRSIGRMQKQVGEMGQAPLGFKIAETAQMPETKPNVSRAKNDIRTMISEEKLERVYVAAQGSPDREWTRKELAEVTGIHQKQIDFGVRVLEMDGKLEKVGNPKGNEPTRYRVVSDGSQ